MRKLNDFEEYTHVVAIKEMSAGNSEVGDTWLETKTFDKGTLVEEILEWANGCGGKLIITLDESSMSEKDELPFG